MRLYIVLPTVITLVSLPLLYGYFSNDLGTGLSKNNAFVHDDLTRLAFNDPPSSFSDLAVDSDEYPDIYRFKNSLLLGGPGDRISGTLFSSDSLTSRIELAHFHANYPNDKTLFWKGNEDVWELWLMTSFWPSSDLRRSYEAIGNVVHLRQDETVPAHRKILWHGSTSVVYNYALPASGPLPQFYSIFGDLLFRRDSFERLAATQDATRLLATTEAEYNDAINQKFVRASLCLDQRRFWLCDREVGDRNVDPSTCGSGDQSKITWGAYGLKNRFFCDWPVPDDDYDWYPESPEDEDADTAGSIDIARRGLYLAVARTKQTLMEYSKKLPPIVKLNAAPKVDFRSAGLTITANIAENRKPVVYLSASLGTSSGPALVAKLDGGPLVPLRHRAIRLNSLADMSQLPFGKTMSIVWNADLDNGGIARVGDTQIVFQVVDADGNFLPARFTTVPVNVVGTVTAPRCDIVPLQLGVPTVGRLTPACLSGIRSSIRGGDIYYGRKYSFNAQAGDMISVSVNSSDFDAFAYLLSGASVVAADDDGGGGRNPLLLVRAPTTGVYTVEITGFAPETGGDFTIEARTSKAGTNSFTGVWDVYEYSARGGKALRHLSVTQDGSALHGTVSDHFVGDEKVDGSGSISGTVQNGAITIAFTVTQLHTTLDGELQLTGRVNRSGDVITGSVSTRYRDGTRYDGFWHATLRKLRPAPFTLDETISRSGDRTYIAAWTPKGCTIDAEVFAERINSPLDSVLAITDSSGLGIIDHNDDAIGSDSKLIGVETTQYAGDSQLYYLRVSGYDETSSGSFRLVVNVKCAGPNNLPVTALPLQIPTSREGVITRPGYANLYSVTLAQGFPVTLDTNAARSGSALDSVITVLGQDGITEIIKNDDSGDSLDSHLSFIPRDEGRYFIAIQDARGSGGVAYTYRLSVDVQIPKGP